MSAAIFRPWPIGLPIGVGGQARQELSEVDAPKPKGEHMSSVAKLLGRRATRALAIVGGVIALVLFNVPVGSASPNSSKPCTNMSDSCLVQVAETYVTAQAGGSGTAAAMRLAPTALRWENGIVTGTSGADIRSKSGFTNPLYSQRDTNRVWVVDHDQVFTFWIVDVRAVAGGPMVSTAHIAERIQIGKGQDVCGQGQLSPCVTQIEAIFCIGQNGNEAAMPPPGTGPSGGLCIRSNI
jgi:hypothetical protein